MTSQYRWYFRESDQALQALQHHQGLSGRDLFLGSCASGMLVSPSSVYEWVRIWVKVPPNSCRFQIITFHDFSDHRPGTRSRSRSTPQWLWPASALCPATPSTRAIDSSTRPLRCLALLLYICTILICLQCRWCLLRLASKNSNLWAVSTSLVWQRAPCPPHLVRWPNLD